MSKVILLENIHIVSVSISEDVVLLSHDCERVLAADFELRSVLHPGSVDPLVNQVLCNFLVNFVSYITILPFPFLQ